MAQSCNPIVHQSGERLFVTSLEISNRFGKRHDNVLRAIENIECSQEFRRLNFEESTYNNRHNKAQPMFEITRDGFVFLCMGFTGTQAALWKERYIQAFNQMEAALRANLPSAERLSQLQTELLIARPDWQALQRYHAAGLTPTEMGKLIGKSAGAVRHLLLRMHAAGLLDYRPSRLFAAAGHKGKQAQQARQLSLAV